MFYSIRPNGWKELKGMKKCRMENVNKWKEGKEESMMDQKNGRKGTD